MDQEYLNSLLLLYKKTIIQFLLIFLLQAQLVVDAKVVQNKLQLP